MGRLSRAVVLTVLVGALVGTVVVPPLVAADLPRQPSDEVTRGEPDFDVFLTEPEVMPGTNDVIELQLQNDGELESGGAQDSERVLTARGVTANVSDTGPFNVSTNEVGVDQVPDGEIVPVSQQLEVPESIDPGEYEIEVTVDYTYLEAVSRITDNARKESKTQTFDVTVVVPEEPRFDLTVIDTDAQPGDVGDTTIEVENYGTETAYDARASMFGASGVSIDGASPEAPVDVSLGDLEPGETTTITVSSVVDEAASEEPRAVDVEVSYENSHGVEQDPQAERLNLAPAGEQTFTIGDVESTLRVGEDGDIHGVVTNTGPRTAQNVQLVYADESHNIVPIENQVLVGSLKPGEEESFRLPLEVTREAEAIDRAIDVNLQYRNADFEQRFYEDVELTTSVLEQRDEFIVDVQDREIEAGETKLIDVEVTNNLDQTASDVEARLFADDPLDSDDDEAFAEALEAGESTTMTFELEAEGSAAAKTHPVSFDFRYDDERDRSQMSDTTRVAINVVDSEGGFPVSTVVVGSLALAALGAVGYTYRQRQP
ncbi:COG1361 S-layer family protein [Natrialbaceae archaeon A-gly3]